MSGYTQEELANSLLRVKQRKQALAGGDPNSPVATRDYREGARNFNDFAPQEMDTKTLDSPFAAQVNELIGKTSTQATAASGVQAQNKFYYDQLLQEQQRLATANKNRVKPSKDKIQQPKQLNAGKNPSILPDGTVNPNLVGNTVYGPGYGPQTGANPTTVPGSSYYTQSPSWLDPNAGLTTFQAGGHSWTLNASVAGRFKGFINALTATGYKIKTAGSYADRDQANGSGQKSLHAYGLAIDINAFGAGNSYNPGNAGVHQTNLPKGISALAAKYGLVWGGDWRNSKDYMHFSVPYGGRLRESKDFKPGKNLNQGPKLNG